MNEIHTLSVESIMSAGFSVYLNGSSREEQPVGSVWRVQVVLQEGVPVGGIDEEHIIKPPTRLISFRALGSLLGPAEAYTVSLRAMWQWKQVDDSAAVTRGSRGHKTTRDGVLANESNIV